MNTGGAVTAAFVEWYLQILTGPGELLALLPVA